jgi:hypothetical protein
LTVSCSALLGGRRAGPSHGSGNKGVPGCKKRPNQTEDQHTRRMREKEAEAAPEGE